MKNIYLSFALLFCIYTNAQNYTFLKTTATYTDLVGTTSLNNDEIWDDPEYSLTLPFSFTINGISTSNVTVSDSYIFLSDATSNSHIISAYGIDLVDRGNNSGNSLSPISYKIDGISPNI